MSVVCSPVKRIDDPLVAFFIEYVGFLLGNDIVIRIRILDKLNDFFLTGNINIGYDIDLALVVYADPFWKYSLCILPDSNAHCIANWRTLFTAYSTNIRRYFQDNRELTRFFTSSLTNDLFYPIMTTWLNSERTPYPATG